MARRRVVVTGLGLVTPLGINVKTNWSKLIAGACGITEIPQSFGPTNSRVAGFVHKDFQTSSFFSKSDEKLLSLFMQYALVAADEAIKDANYTPTTELEREMTGVCIGSGIGSLQDITDGYSSFQAHGLRKVSPYFVPKLLLNMAAGHVSMKYGFKGPNHSVTTACATGAHSIGDASRFIEYGDADVMIAGGSEASITPLAVAGFSKLRALSTNFNDSPELASRPFDKDRDGFVIGEGAGVVVLEEYNHAVNRGANIYCELTGYGLSGDSHHITSPPDDGSGAARAMRRALAHSKADPEEIDYINAHATSTPLGDLVETRAIKGIFGDSVAVSSTKGSIGHLLGAAGAVEAIYAILAVKNNVIPPTINLNAFESDEFSLDYVANVGRDVSTTQRRSASGTGVKYAMSNSFGFGGTNCSLCFKKIDN
ncbi:hypothetical protein HDV04_003602 [Boothiomyces sp. JEL0838]|nr:hypothetical protein HDV04_003602 [Boothiomyces sp. JEL0838]